MDAASAEREVSLILPAYREAARLPRTIDGILEYLDRGGRDWEVRVVDDGSDDDTLAVIQRLAAADPRVVPQAEPHRGKGGAVRAGMLAARARHRVMCDADMAMPVDQVERLLQRLAAGVDVAIASREAPGARRYGEPHHRHAMGRVFNAAVRIAAVRGIEDTQCGFKGFTAAAAERLFRRSLVNGFAFDVEILFLARRAGLRVEEVPIDWYHDPDSRVNPLRDTRRMLSEIARIRLNDALGMYQGI